MYSSKATNLHANGKFYIKIGFGLGFFFTLFLLACDRESIHIVRHPNGKIREMWTEKGNSSQLPRREGPSKSYFPSGVLESLIEYHDGKKSGSAQFWTESGKLRFSGVYANNFLVQEKRFDGNGKLFFASSYLVISHSIKVLIPDGDSIFASEKCTWTHQLGQLLNRHGLCETRYPNGQMHSTRHFHQGLLQGTFKTRYPNGAPWVEGQYWQNHATGTWRSWYSTGKLLSLSHWENGKRHGITKEWYSTGKLHLQSKYQFGLREGTETTWYPEGQKQYTGDFKQGMVTGDFWKWYPNGSIKMQCHFLNGKKEGSYRTWGPQGTILTSQFFRKGAVVFDAKAKELRELLGAELGQVPVGLFGFYWGMSMEDCKANLDLLQARNQRFDTLEIEAKLSLFIGPQRLASSMNLQFNTQGELSAIQLNLHQRSTGDFFKICKNLEKALDASLGRTTLHRSKNAQSYALFRENNWGKFTLSTHKGKNASEVISQDLSVVRAQIFSPGGEGWFRFSLINFLYHEYTDPNTTEISPPIWPESRVLAIR